MQVVCIYQMVKLHPWRIVPRKIYKCHFLWNGQKQYDNSISGIFSFRKARGATQKDYE